MASHESHDDSRAWVRRPSQGLADAAMSAAASVMPSPPPLKGFRASLGLDGVARRTIGIALLLLTVCLWTLCNFLASFIFSDHTYDKPFFLVYVNSSVFAIGLIPRFSRYLYRNGTAGLRQDTIQMWHECRQPKIGSKRTDEESDPVAAESLLISDEDVLETTSPAEDRLGFYETARLGLDFSMLWFLANYFASACLEYTSVSSVTVLTSMSSMWTLIFCALFGVEAFSIRKLFGVLASLAGIVLISTVDLSGNKDEDRGSFPHKTTSQIAIGDSMAFLSALVYGVYVTVMKRRVGNEDRVDMRLFFGWVGVWNLVLLWPLFFILHWTNIEPFEMPSETRIWVIIIVNSVAAYASDISWAFAMLLTTPLVVAVGLSLTIPLSLIGEMIQYGQYSSFVYWIGAALVLVSFVFINKESAEEAERENP